MKLDPRFAVCAAGLFACASGAFAQPAANDAPSQAQFEQHLGQALPASLAFRDESGAPVELSDYYGTAPIVLVFAWYGCTTLCPTVVGSLAHALDGSGAIPGRDYQVVVASIDPRDSPATAMRMKQVHLASVAAPDDLRSWHLLSGSETAISTLAQAAGFRYAYDAQTHQYAHPTGITLLTPQGRIARYFPGFTFTAATLRTAFHDAAARQIASPADRLWLLCFHVAPTGRYSAAILQALRFVAAGALVVALAVALRARRRRPAAPSG